ncbi:MAG: 4-(cytidine 5'-diphospho)-2-C-methyl-D-erythritol kinase [Candidatus Marinimicrobia bacterium]|nr:4-(cytidine 5'-diphospho)-2-C-methyl-D-erythritol kinase [Candidatus Neomarinimicrobiota bacterium]
MLILEATAKVNIGLQIRDQRADGYHNLHTVFQELDFADSITIAEARSGYELTTNVNWVPINDTNLCIKAFKALKARFPNLPGVQIQLEKRIPAGAGLGGGSSNGAAVLKGLNELYSLGLSQGKLERIAVKIGADVPFFIRGGIQLGEGIGDKLTPLSVSMTGIFLLVIPPIHINTGWAYGEVKKRLNNQRKHINFRCFFQGRNTPWELFENDFEQIIIPTYPEIGAIKQRLIETGAYYASLSGSGSTVYGVFDDEAVATAVESEFKKSCQTILTHPSKN